MQPDYNNYSLDSKVNDTLADLNYCVKLPSNQPEHIRYISQESEIHQVRYG